MLIKTERTPWTHQEREIVLAETCDHRALLWEPGVGKTFATICMCRVKYAQAKQVLPTLILAPLSVLHTWAHEWREHAPGHVAQQVVILAGKTQAARRKKLREAWSTDKRIIIANHELISHCRDLWDDLTSFPFQILVVDESQRFKSPAAKRTRALIKFADKIKTLKLCLSGTPVLNGPEDVWAQFRILGRDILEPNYKVFKEKYFYDANAEWRTKPKYFPEWKILPGSEEQIKSLLACHASRVIKKEVLDLPPFVRKTIYCELTLEQHKHYTELEREFLTRVSSPEFTTSECVTDLAIVQLMRLQQICSGVLPVVNRDQTGAVVSHETRQLANTKLAALRDLLEQLVPEHKVIIWTAYRGTYEPIRELLKELGIGFAELTGDTATSDRARAVERFAQDNSCRVFLSNQAAGGAGINLQAASYEIYFSKTHKLEDDLQSEARCYRGGSEIHESVTRIDLVCQDTVEEKLTQALSAKLATAEMLLSFRGTHTERIAA